MLPRRLERVVHNCIVVQAKELANAHMHSLLKSKAAGKREAILAEFEAQNKDI